MKEIDIGVCIPQGSMKHLILCNNWDITYDFEEYSLEHLKQINKEGWTYTDIDWNIDFNPKVFLFSYSQMQYTINI